LNLPHTAAGDTERTTMLSRSRRLIALTSALTAVALAVSACGSSNSGTAASSPLSAAAAAVSSGDASPAAEQAVQFNLSPDQNRISTDKVDSIAAEVPQAIRDRGTLLVTGTAGTAPPLGFYATDDSTIIGSEIDFATLIGDVLGLKVDYSAADWAQNFVRIDSSQADAFISNVTVTEERKEKYDFATYRLDTLALETQKDTDWTVNGRKDLAGKIIAVGSGTNQEKILVGWNDANVAEGLAPIDIKYFQNSTDYYLALSSGRIDAYFGPNPTAQYHVASSGETKVIGTFSGAGDALQGEIAVLTKKDNALVKAFADAINHTIENGTYQQVLDRWNLDSEAVKTSEVNPPGLPKTAS
jgi:polar amino acid transport system substrate-binding protein